MGWEGPSLLIRPQTNANTDLTDRPDRRRKTTLHVETPRTVALRVLRSLFCSMDPGSILDPGDRVLTGRTVWCSTSVIAYYSCGWNKVHVGKCVWHIGFVLSRYTAEY